MRVRGSEGRKSPNHRDQEVMALPPIRRLIASTSEKPADFLRSSRLLRRRTPSSFFFLSPLFDSWSGTRIIPCTSKATRLEDTSMHPLSSSPSLFFPLGGLLDSLHSLPLFPFLPLSFRRQGGRTGSWKTCLPPDA